MMAPKTCTAQKRTPTLPILPAGRQQRATGMAPTMNSTSSTVPLRILETSCIWVVSRCEVLTLNKEKIAALRFPGLQKRAVAIWTEKRH